MSSNNTIFISDDINKVSKDFFLNKSITFIGMPGCGKSTLAKYFTNHVLIEVDQYIEEKYGKTLFELIEIYGDEEFKKIEENAILEINFDTKKVISPGGSVIYCEKGMKHLKNKNNLIIYLKTDFDKLVERTNNFTNRGIVFNGLTPKELYEERDKLYEKYADIIVETKNYSIEKLVNIFK
jgi:shikimate kinase